MSDIPCGKYFVTDDIPPSTPADTTDQQLGCSIEAFHTHHEGEKLSAFAIDEGVWTCAHFNRTMTRNLRYLLVKPTFHITVDLKMEGQVDPFIDAVLLPHVHHNDVVTTRTNICGKPCATGELLQFLKRDLQAGEMSVVAVGVLPNAGALTVDMRDAYYTLHPQHKIGLMRVGYSVQDSIDKWIPRAGKVYVGQGKVARLSDQGRYYDISFNIEGGGGLSGAKLTFFLPTDAAQRARDAGHAPHTSLTNVDREHTPEGHEAWFNGWWRAAEETGLNNYGRVLIQSEFDDFVRNPVCHIKENPSPQPCNFAQYLKGTRSWTSRMREDFPAEWERTDQWAAAGVGERQFQVRCGAVGPRRGSRCEEWTKSHTYHEFIKKDALFCDACSKKAMPINARDRTIQVRDHPERGGAAGDAEERSLGVRMVLCPTLLDGNMGC